MDILHYHIGEDDGSAERRFPRQQMSNFFKPWPKIPRFGSKCAISEKLDGTNASILIKSANEFLFDEFGYEAAQEDADKNRCLVLTTEGVDYYMWAFSRKRQIWAGADNFGFAHWVNKHKYKLLKTLGIGRHFGEWWGKGIQRGYGLEEKRFSLFNTHRHHWLNDVEAREAEGVDFPLYCVPPLYHGGFNVIRMQQALENLQVNGSVAAPGFMNPEGVVVFFRDSEASFKHILNGEDGKDISECLF